VLQDELLVADVEPPDPLPTPVVTSRATLVDTDALASYEAAAAWLGGADLEGLAAAALVRLNRVLHAHRIASADPLRARSRVSRRSSCGWGSATARASPTGAGIAPASCCRRRTRRRPTPR
jgi:hypothetical protein